MTEHKCRPKDSMNNLHLAPVKQNFCFVATEPRASRFPFTIKVVMKFIWYVWIWLLLTMDVSFLGFDKWLSTVPFPLRWSCFPRHLVGESRLILLHIESVSLPPESKCTFISLYCAKILLPSHGLESFFCPKLYYRCALAFMAKTGPFSQKMSLFSQRKLLCVNTTQQCWHFLRLWYSCIIIEVLYGPIYA